MRLYERKSFQELFQSLGIVSFSSPFFFFLSILFESSARFSGNKPDLRAPCSMLQRNRRLVDLHMWEENGLFIIPQIYVFVGKLDI